jgi:hypothetical protein
VLSLRTKIAEKRIYFSKFLVPRLGMDIARYTAQEVRNKMKHLFRRFGGGIVGLFLLLGIGFVSSQTAQAQYRNYPQTRDRDWNQNRDWNRDQDSNRRRDSRYGYGGSFELRQTALNAGFNEGLKAGRKDRRRGERFEYRDEGAFQKATSDYNSRYGDRELYRQYYRQGFANGYNAGYQNPY